MISAKTFASLLAVSTIVAGRTLVNRGYGTPSTGVDGTFIISNMLDEDPCEVGTQPSWNLTDYVFPAADADAPCFSNSVTSFLWYGPAASIELYDNNLCKQDGANYLLGEVTVAANSGCSANLILPYGAQKGWKGMKFRAA